MTTFVCWNVFDEIERLPMMVSAADRVIGGRVKHVFVDGRYPDFPADHDYSTDGTFEYAQDAGYAVPCMAVENTKRTYGFHVVDCMAQPEDIVIVLDADECLLTYRPPDGRVGVLGFMRLSDGAHYERARVFRWARGMFVGPRHYDVQDRHGLVATLTSGLNAATCGSGVHHDLPLSDERRRAKAAYYQHLMRSEEQISPARL